MKHIDILFITSNNFYNYTHDEIIFKNHVYYNIIFCTINDYKWYISSKYFNFKYIFLFVNEYYDLLLNAIFILNSIFSPNNVIVLCNKNYPILKAKINIFTNNDVIYFYYKFKNKNIINNKDIPIQIDNSGILSLIWF